MNVNNAARGSWKKNNIRHMTGSSQCRHRSPRSGIGQDQVKAGNRMRYTSDSSEQDSRGDFFGSIFIGFFHPVHHSVDEH